MSIAQIVEQYLNENPLLIKYSSEGLLNISALARKIRDEKKIKKSEEAVMVALHRFFSKISLNNEKTTKQIKKIIESSVVNLRTNYAVGVYSTQINAEFDAVISFGKTCVVLGEKQNMEKIRKKARYYRDNLFLIEIKHGKNIEDTPGVVFHILARLYQANISIVEIFSAWDTTYILIKNKELKRIFSMFFK